MKTAHSRAGLRVYREDPEEYWTHFTPEAAKYLLLYKEEWKVRFMAYPKDHQPLVVSIRIHTPTRIGKKGIQARMRDLAMGCGLRPQLQPGQKRHKIMLDHGLRKYFNTMCRRAKINFADKEELQGREAGKNESHYGRYEEADFERWEEYQKVIPFLTIDDGERERVKNQKLSKERDLLKLKLHENTKLQEQLKQERQARLEFEKEMKQTLAQLREEKLQNYKE